MIFIVNRKRYNTETAEVLATNQTHNSTRWTSLFRTKKGSYFSVRFTNWVGEKDTIHPDMTEEEAANMYETLERMMKWEKAFPNLKLEEA